MTRGARAVRLLLAGLVATLALLAAGVLTAPAAQAIPGIPDCKEAPTPEVPGRGVVGFFESGPQAPPPPGDPFAPNSTTTIHQQYGYAGLRWNTYDLGCGPDLARSPDAAVGTSVSNWIVTFPKTVVAATGAVVGAAFDPEFLGVFDPLVSAVVDTLRETVFEQWIFLTIGAVGLLLVWRSRQASLASSAGAVGWALLVLVLATVVFRWPLVAGNAADETVTGTLGAVAGGLNGTAPQARGDASAQAIGGMHEALLYQAWLGGTFGDANSEVARRYGPAIFTAQALSWREARILEEDPARGREIIEAKQTAFEDAAEKVAAEDPDAYEYLTGKRSDTRVGYALLAGFATLCAVPFLIVAGLLVLGALIIVRFGVMLFPAFATLGLFPTMRGLVTGIGNTMAAALINAVIFGIGAAVTVRGIGVLLAPSTNLAPWLDVVLVLLLTIVMWVTLRPFRRLSHMVSRNRNHFASATGGVGSVTRGMARTAGGILTTALGTFLGASAANRNADDEQELRTRDGVPQRAEAVSSLAADSDAPAGAQAPATLTGPVSITTGSVLVSAAPAGDDGGDVYTPAADSRARAGAAPGRAEGATAGAGVFAVAGAATGAATAAGGRAERRGGAAVPAATAASATSAAAATGGPARPVRGEAARNEGARNEARGAAASPARGKREPFDLADFGFDELAEIFRPERGRPPAAPGGQARAEGAEPAGGVPARVTSRVEAGRGR